MCHINFSPCSYLVFALHLNTRVKGGVKEAQRLEVKTEGQKPTKDTVKSDESPGEVDSKSEHQEMSKSDLLN